MGLPLYVAPVESDFRSRPPAPKSPAAHSRSAIRRTHRRTGESGEARHRALAQELDRLRALEAETQTHGAIRERENRAALQDLLANRRPSAVDERALNLIGERWGGLHTGTDADAFRDETPSSSAGDDRHLRVWRSSVRGIASSASARAGRRPRSALVTEARRGLTSRTSRWSPERPSRVRNAVRLNISGDGPLSSSSPPLSSARPARLDGLGDRNRSLSPEGDSVWDTLLTTLTPDPQPPSVGSSFASASASASTSAATSQSTTAGGSSRTSFTGRDAGEESGFEQNCESGCEGSETEGDEDDDDQGERHMLTRFPTSLRNRRSYADVAGRTTSNSSSGEDVLDVLGDMQRIVRHFARREDIPDEWWAEAGLSRTLSREASN